MMSVDNESVRYGIRPTSGPITDAEAMDLETTTDCLEVIVSWGPHQVLHVAHVPLDGTFVIGERGEGEVDFLAGSETLGLSRLALLEGGRLQAPSTAEVVVTRDGKPVEGAPTLVAGESCYVDLGELRFVVRRVRAGKKAARQPLAVERQPLFFVGGAMAVAGFLLALFALMPPSGAALALNDINQDSRLVQYLMEPPVAEEIEAPVEVAESPGGTEGQAHEGDEGEMGDRDAPQANNAYAVEGPRDNPDPHLARERAREQAASAGILGALANLQGAFDSPTSPFGRETALGTDAESALGHLMGENLGAAQGNGGLGLNGSGRGAGGRGLGTIGVGEYGTLGHGCTGRCSEGTQYGHGVGHVAGRNHRPQGPPRMDTGRVEAIGGLSREAIRRVINRHKNEVKFCYEQGLQSRPDLEGRVTMRFMIAPSGAVQVASVQSSSLRDNRVESCVTSAVRRWSFPQPEGGGAVMVTYPFSLVPAS